MIKKKILSTFLTLCMLLTLVPTTSIPVYANLAITNIQDKTLTPLVVGYDSGDKETATYTLKNFGDVTFTSLELVKQGANPDSFSVTLQSTGPLATGETTTFTAVAVDGLAAGTYSVDVYVKVNGGEITWCRITQEVLATKGTQVAPNQILYNYSHYNANDGRLYDLTTAMEYKLSTDTDYIPCTGTEVNGLAPATYNLRYKETALLSASPAVSITIHEIVGGLTANLAPLSPAQDNKMLLTIAEDTRVLGGTIYYIITNNAVISTPSIGERQEFSTSIFNSNFYQYTGPVEIAILDGDYVVALKMETTINGENTDAIFNKYGVSSAANDEFTPAAPSGLDAVNMPYGETNSGKIVGTTTAMEYKLSSEDETAYQDCANTETTGLAEGNYVIRFKATSDEIASQTVTKTVKQIAGGITATLAPLSTPKENKVMLTISEDIRQSLGTIMYIIVEDTYIDGLNMYVNDELDFGSVDSDIQLLRYANPVEIGITKGHKVLALKGDVRISGTNTVIVKSYKAGISSEPNDGYTAPTGGGGGSVPASNEISGTVGDTTKPVGTTQDTTTSDGKSETIVKIDQDKIDALIKDISAGKTIVIPTNSKSDIVAGQLNGQTVKNMEAKEAVLEIRTGNTTYTLPASQINIDSVSAQIGKEVALKDITVRIQISNASSVTAQIVAVSANKNSYMLVVKPVEFEITCKSDSKTVEVSKFNGYVERTVAIPDGVDASRITTGVVLNADGTFSHVPTTILKIDGKYYAKINSLTNSTYSVIYNPLKFTDVVGYWAEDAINDMGSRLVVTGVGNGKYEPLRDITRAEFVAILTRSLGLKADAGASGFEDVASTDWYNGYLSTAVKYDLITGYDSNSFLPNEKITREQAMVIIARAMKLTSLNSTADTSVLNGYTDASAISSYAVDSVSKCISSGLIKGANADTLNSATNITRAEVAVVVQRLLVKSNLINY